MMNKLELIEQFRHRADISKPEAKQIVDEFFGLMAKTLAQDRRVEIRGLCSFFVKKYQSYTGRNPKTGRRVKVKPKRLPFFKCGKDLKERVDRLD